MEVVGISVIIFICVIQCLIAAECCLIACLQVIILKLHSYFSWLSYEAKVDKEGECEVYKSNDEHKPLPLTFVGGQHH